MHEHVTEILGVEPRISPDLISVTVDEAARITGVGRSTVYKAMASGELVGFTNGRRRLFLIEDLKAWVRKMAKENSR